MSIAQDRVITVLLDELHHAPHEPLHLRIPSDRRVIRIASTILMQPENNCTLIGWAEFGGLSARMLSRLFRT